MSEQIERTLSELLTALRGVPASAREAAPTEAIHVAVSQLHAKIKEACEEGYEVHVYKGSRVLRMGAVGPLKGTRFAYTLAPYAVPTDEDDKCDLCAATDIRLHRGFRVS